MPIIANFSLLFVMCHTRQEQREILLSLKASRHYWFEGLHILSLSDKEAICTVARLESFLVCLSRPLHLINKDNTP